MTWDVIQAALLAVVVFVMMLASYQRGQTARVPHDDSKLMETLKKQDDTIKFQADTIKNQDSVMQQQSKVLREQSDLLNRARR